jgi:hypothetical protein
MVPVPAPRRTKITMSSNRVFMPVAGRLVIPSPDEPAGIDVVGDEPAGPVVGAVVRDGAMVVVLAGAMVVVLAGAVEVVLAGAVVAVLEAAVVVVTVLATQALLTILFESRVTAPLRANN